MVLANNAPQLPALRSVLLSEGNDLVPAGEGVPGTIADLNGIVGYDLFT